MVRLIGPSWAVPEISAGGAVEEPLPSIWMRTLGYCRRKPSAHRVIRLLSVSEPTELKLPETPPVFWYGAMLESTLTAWAASRVVTKRAAVARPVALPICFMGFVLLLQGRERRHCRRAVRR